MVWITYYIGWESVNQEQLSLTLHAQHRHRTNKNPKLTSSDPKTAIVTQKKRKGERKRSGKPSLTSDITHIHNVSHMSSRYLVTTVFALSQMSKGPFFVDLRLQHFSILNLPAYYLCNYISKFLRACLDLKFFERFDYFKLQLYVCKLQSANLLTSFLNSRLLNLCLVLICNGVISNTIFFLSCFGV